MTLNLTGERAGEREPIVGFPNILLKQVPYAKQRQRDGRTLSEIARELRVNRQSVVDALYWSLM